MAKQVRITASGGPNAAFSGRQGITGWGRMLVFVGGTSEWVSYIGDDGIEGLTPGYARERFPRMLDELGLKVFGQGNFSLEYRTI